MQTKVPEAIPLFREAIRLNPKYWEARHNLATAYLTLGRLEESKAELALLLEMNPGMVQAQKSMARVTALLANEVRKKP